MRLLNHFLEVNPKRKQPKRLTPKDNCLVISYKQSSNSLQAAKQMKKGKKLSRIS